MVHAVIGDTQLDLVNATRQMAMPRDVLNALANLECAIHIRPPLKGNWIVFWVGRTASIEENQILTCRSIALKRESSSRHLVVQLDFNSVGI